MSIQWFNEYASKQASNQFNIKKRRKKDHFDVNFYVYNFNLVGIYLYDDDDDDEKKNNLSYFVMLCVINVSPKQKEEKKQKITKFGDKTCWWIKLDFYEMHQKKRTTHAHTTHRKINSISFGFNQKTQKIYVSFIWQERKNGN